MGAGWGDEVWGRWGEGGEGALNADAINRLDS